MSARSFKSVGWVAGIGAAALTCYMFSLSVAAERAELAELDSQIVELRQSIRTLNTELGTRGRVHQLQHWASADFGFAAPAANQFLDSEVTLAQLELPSEASPLEAPVRMASAAQAPAGIPRVVQASASAAQAPSGRPAVAIAAAQAPAPRQPLLRQASVTRIPAGAEARPAARRPSVQPAAARAITPPARAATRPTALVNERTLRELSSRERGERSAGEER